MSKKLFISLASLLAITAFAVMPVAAQAAGLHYYKNGAKMVESERVPVVAWGELSLTSSAGTVTCKNVVGGYAENPAGGGPGVGQTQSFATYECSTEKCPLETRAEAIKAAGGAVGWGATPNPWLNHLTETAGTTRLETTGVDVIIGCWTTSPNGPGNTATTERGSPVAPLLPFTGSSTPRLSNGTTAGHPSKTIFGPGSGELTGPGGLKGSTSGEVSTLGYNEQELITVGA